MNDRVPDFVKFNARSSLLRRCWPWRTTPTQSRSLLRLIAVAVEHQLPLAPLLESWSQDERGVQRRRVRRIAQLLQAGRSLPDAVEEVSGALRDSEVLAIRFGSQSGTLAATLASLQRDAVQRPAVPRVRWTAGYLLLVLSLFFLIALFTYTKIVPAINNIIEDFELEWPTPLTWSINLGLAFEHYWWVIAISVSLLAWSFFSPRPGRFLRNKFLSKFFGPLRNLRAADLLEKLSITSAAGRPVSGAISTLARYHFDPTTRRKLLFVRNEMEHGADVWQSLERVGLLTAPEQNLLAAADRVGNRSWTLEQLAASKKRRIVRLAERLSELLLPLIVFLLGAFVLLQALSLLTPLVQLIYSLA